MLKPESTPLRRVARLAGLLGCCLSLLALAPAQASRASAQQPAASAPQPRASAPPAGSPLALHEHPRLWMTKAMMPELRAKLAGPFNAEYQAFIKDLDSRYDAAFKRADYFDVLNYAFVYQVGTVANTAYARPPAAYGELAARLFNRAIAEKRGFSQLGVGYDWLYPLLTEEERRAAVAHLRSSFVSRAQNPFDDNVLGARQASILAGLAFWGDGIDDAAADQMIARWDVDVMNGGVLDAANFIAGDDGGWSQGFGYSLNGDVLGSIGLLRLLEGWRTAHGLSKAQVYSGPAAAVFRYYPQWFAYHILPPRSEGTPARTRYVVYKTHHMGAGRGTGSWATARAVLAALRLFNDVHPETAALAAWLLENRTGPLAANGTDGRRSAVFSHFLMGERVTPRGPSDLKLPLSKLFGGLGWVAMRTGWDSAADSVVTFIASPWSRESGSYTNINQGSFTIDRRGPLAINSGLATHQAYANSTWAHNTMLFVDPAERAPKDRSDWDRGGQRKRFPLLASGTLLKDGSVWDLGGLGRAATGRTDLFDGTSTHDYDYMFADVTRAYNGPLVSDDANTSKVRRFTRQFVYFRPRAAGESDRVVVFDRVATTDARFEPRWLLHTAGNPQIDGDERSVREGEWQYSGASLITATNSTDGSSGRLFARTLLPARRTVVKIGGPGHEFEDPYGDSDTKTVNKRDAVSKQYSGEYRVEVRAAAGSTDELFLHVLEAVDATTAAATPAGLLNGSTLVGARVGDHLAIFNRREGAIADGQIAIDRPGTYRVLISDLGAGSTYDLRLDGRVVTRTATAAGTIYFDATVTQPDTLLTIAPAASRGGRD
jgi:hypothetical protein